MTQQKISRDTITSLSPAAVLRKAVRGMSIGEAVETLMRDGMPLRFTAYDGSEAGDPDSDVGVHLASAKGLAYLLTAPGDLGLARAYTMGELQILGAHEGDPYEVMVRLMNHTKMRRPRMAELPRLLAALEPSHLVPPPVPPQEHLPPWRRVVEGLRHSQARDAEAISHHYDVSNEFYEHVLGPSMTYTCAAYPKESSTLEEAQFEKYDLVCRKLGLEKGMRLLDIGCGWGGMARHAAREYGVQVIGATLSREQASWAQAAVEREGLADLVEIRHSDYRDVPETGFDAVSSIGLTEHIGVRQYPAYFGWINDRLVDGGRLLNHCITRPHDEPTKVGHFIDRYVFPDGELTGVATVSRHAAAAGFEIQHVENLRRHYAMTLRDWCANLVEHWDECVELTDLGTARVWGLYMASCRLGFERNEIQLHQVLATKTVDGFDGMALRHDW